MNPADIRAQNAFFNPSIQQMAPMNPSMMNLNNAQFDYSRLPIICRENQQIFGFSQHALSRLASRRMSRSMSNLNFGFSNTPPEVGTPTSIRNANQPFGSDSRPHSLQMPNSLDQLNESEQNSALDLATPFPDRPHLTSQISMPMPMPSINYPSMNGNYENNLRNAFGISKDDTDSVTDGVQYRKNISRLTIPGMKDSVSMAGSTMGSSRNGYRSAKSYAASRIIENTLDEQDLPRASTRKEKWKLTRRFFVTILSICYAIFLVVFGAIVFIGDVVVSQYPLPQVLCIYMLLTSFAYFLFLHIDIRFHLARTKKAFEQRNTRNQLIEEYLSRTKGDSVSVNPAELRMNHSLYVQAVKELNLPPIEKVLHRYCFINGRHGECLYLKLGAAWFAFGLLIHSILQISYQVFFLSSNGDSLYDCASYITLSLDVLFPLYSLFTLFFIVKYMNVVINVNRGLARFCLMHAIGSSLGFWVFIIVRETAESIARSDADELNFKLQEQNETLIYVYHDCGKSVALNAINRQFSPYLYPFIIEYCILVSGIWYNMYANIHQCPQILEANDKDENNDTPAIDNDGDSFSRNSSSSEMPFETDHDNDFQANNYVYADCNSSFRGMFAGLMLMIISIVFIILMFVGVQNEAYLKTSIEITSFFELFVLAIMTITAALAYLQTIQLDINPNPIKKLDDILMFIAVPAFCMESVFSLVPAIHHRQPLHIAIAAGRVIQVFLQTSFIIDGLRRCSNDPKLRDKKPGRELVIFLTIANISLWIFHTFSVKTASTGDDRFEFYGYTLWNILNHVTVPLGMFYRFHSSVCLVDIWGHAYEAAPLEH